MTAFTLSLVMLLIYSIIQGIFPFGEATFLRKDLYHQYLPFLYELRRRLINGQSLKYSFDLGLGASFYAMYVYYLSDPLNLLSVLVPEGYLLEFLTLITYMKIALSSSFMCRYLRYRSADCPVGVCVLLSLCYGFSGYCAAFDWNVMWMWGIALAPLVLMGYEKLIKGEGSALYILTMAFTVWTNYYIAMIMGIFLVIYFFVFSAEESKDILSFIRGAARAIPATALAGGMSAVLLIPEYMAVRATSFTGKSLPGELKFYMSVPELMTRSLMAVKVETSLGHEPGLYASLFVLILIPLFFLNRNIPLRIRIIRGGLIAFFYLSFDLNLLEFIWHGMNYPDSIPARQAFLFIIVCLCCASMAFTGAEEFGKIRPAVSAAVPPVFFAACFVFCRNEDHTDIYTWIMNAVFILMYMLLASVYIFKKTEFGKWGKYALGTVVVFELIFNFNMTSLRDVSRESYFRHVLSYRALAEEGAGMNRLNQGLFSRFDTEDENIRNISCLSGYHDVSYFSSTIDRGVTDYYKKFGMKASRVHYMGEGLTPFTSAVMGVNYVIANYYRNNQTDYDIASFKDEEGEDYLYENAFALPFGYTVPSCSYEFDERDDPYEDPLGFQNTVSLKLSGDKIFSDIDGGYIDDEPGKTVISIPEDGHYYAWTYADVDEIKEYTDFDDEMYEKFDDLHYDSILDLGRLDKGTVVTLVSDTDDTMYISLYRFDAEKMGKLTEMLSEDTLTLTDFTDDHIEGIIDMPEDRELLLAMPASEGWEITLDGTERVEAETFYNLFMLLSIPPGIHHISLIYHIPYFMTGLLISVLSFIAAAIYLVLYLKRIRW